MSGNLKTDSVTLVGLDFGSTTSSAAIASAQLTCNSVTGRIELRNIEPQFCSEQVFTPFRGDQLDEARIVGYLDQWLQEVSGGEVFGGGAMITGLAAQAANSNSVASQIRRYLKDAVIASTADPCLESWLAFMGNCWEISRANPNRFFINLDIGGGTTNLALGRNGEVLRTGSFFVGARHIRVEPGGYRIAALSSYARALLDYLGIHKSIGAELTETDVQRIVDWYLLLLESAVTGTAPGTVDSLAAIYGQVPFESGRDSVDAVVTFSGGVGQLAYRGFQSNTWPGTTAYGDLGIDMARRLVHSSFWNKQLTRWAPTGLGRATLFGLLRHNTQVSGNTLYLSDAGLLPLSDLVIIGSVSPDTPPDELDHLMGLVARSSKGACLRIDGPQFDGASLRPLADQLRQAIARQPAIEHLPLVILVRENLGKYLGQLITNWGGTSAKVVVIDEIDSREAQFASVGRLHQGVLPVTFHGMNNPLGSQNGR